jgi:hypothetical protein
MMVTRYNWVSGRGTETVLLSTTHHLCLHRSRSYDALICQQSMQQEGTPDHLHVFRYEPPSRDKINLRQFLGMNEQRHLLALVILSSCPVCIIQLQTLPTHLPLGMKGECCDETNFAQHPWLWSVSKTHRQTRCILVKTYKTCWPYKTNDTVECCENVNPLGMGSSVRSENGSNFVMTGEEAEIVELHTKTQAETWLA